MVQNHLGLVLLFGKNIHLRNLMEIFLGGVRFKAEMSAKVDNLNWYALNSYCSGVSTAIFDSLFHLVLTATCRK